MNFLNYDKYMTEASNTEAKSYVSNSDILTFNTNKVDIKVTTDESYIKIDYNFTSIIPKNATIKLISIVLYGYMLDIKEYISSNQSLFRIISIPSKYSKLEMDVRIEYVDESNSLFKINESIPIDLSLNTITTSFQVNKPNSTFMDLDSYLKHLENRITALESRIKAL